MQVDAALGRQARGSSDFCAVLLKNNTAGLATALEATRAGTSATHQRHIRATTGRGPSDAVPAATSGRLILIGEVQREHGEHENERRDGHDSRRGRYESLSAGLFVTGSLRFLGSRARFVEVFAQIGFGLGARPLGRVHRDEETRNGTNGSSTTSCLLLF